MVRQGLSVARTHIAAAASSPRTISSNASEEDKPGGIPEEYLPLPRKGDKLELLATVLSTSLSEEDGEGYKCSSAGSSKKRKVAAAGGTDTADYSLALNFLQGSATALDIEKHLRSFATEPLRNMPHRDEGLKITMSAVTSLKELYDMTSFFENQYHAVKKTLSAQRKQYEENLQATLKQVAKAEERAVLAEQKLNEMYWKLEEAQRQAACAEAERDKILGSFGDVKAAQKVECFRTCETLKKVAEEARVASEKAAAVECLTAQLYQQTQKFNQINNQDEATVSKIKPRFTVD